MKTLILGIGNPLRSDDGVGLAVVEALRKIPSIPEDVEIIDGGTSELQALLFMQEVQRVFIVDAADMGADPGQWRCFQVEEIAPELDMPEHCPNLHHMGLKEMISLGRVLHILPMDIHIYAVQPQTVKYSLNLSEVLAPAVEQVSQDIRRRLGEAYN
jgi:hydrogenase maturation protease